MVKLKVSKELDREKISITLTLGLGWNVTLYPLVREGKIISVDFPDEPGIFMLNIKYAKDLFYREWILYRTSLRNEELSFSFYKEQKRIFCAISSELADELNKEIVLNPLPNDLKLILEDLSQ